MKAVALTRYLPVSDPEVFRDVDLPRPVAEGRDLLVAVKAVSVNPIDTKVRAPKDIVEDPPRVLGWDASGVVEAVGPDVRLFKPGDAVYYAGDITRPGSNAEFQLVDERIVGFKPESLGFAEAAALPLTTITAYEAFFDRLGELTTAILRRPEVSSCNGRLHVEGRGQLSKAVAPCASRTPDGDAGFF